MGRTRHIAVLLLGLAVHAMLIAPSVHQLEHARANDELRREVARQAGHVHTDFQGISSALEGVSHQLAACSVCRVLLQTLLLQPVAVRSTTAVTLDSPRATTLHSAAEHSRRAIRAPPAAS